jgi:hypothetical protein
MAAELASEMTNWVKEMSAMSVACAKGGADRDAL